MSAEKILESCSKMLEQFGELREYGIDLSMMPKKLYDARALIMAVYSEMTTRTIVKDVKNRRAKIIGLKDER